ncbi:MAG TPA: hypothetical protein VF517_10905 [Thermoleophilaceae bacterium]
MPVEDITAPSYPPREQANFGRMPLLQALRRHWPLAVLPVLLLVGAAIAIGLQREPEYESESRLNVGGLNLTQQSIEGYTTAVQALAVSYSRAIDATPVTEPAADELGLTPGEVADRISATPIQGSPVIRVIAKGDDAAETVRLADAAGDNLVDYAEELNSGGSQSGRLLKRFRAASRELRAIGTDLRRARRRNSRNVERLEAREDIARLEQQVAGTLYQNAQAGQATIGLVQKLAPATRAKSDRDDYLRQLVAGGAIGGLLIGIGLAVWRGNAVARRRLGAY